VEGSSVNAAVGTSETNCEGAAENVTEEVGSTEIVEGWFVTLRLGPEVRMEDGGDETTVDDGSNVTNCDVGFAEAKEGFNVTTDGEREEEGTVGEDGSAVAVEGSGVDAVIGEPETNCVGTAETRDGGLVTDWVGSLEDEG
jgi:hypothetical protein